MAQPTTTLGTLLRHLIELLDGAVEETYAEAGLDYRPRYTPVMRALIEMGPASIKAISQRAGITHSAVSQTVAQMAKHGLIRLKSSNDGRERIVTLTSKATAMVPELQHRWTATNAAASGLDAELSASLHEVLREAIAALERQSFSKRIARASRRKETQ